MRARARTVPIRSAMNETEARFASEILEPLKLAGKISRWGFELIKLRLAKATFYTPDFWTVSDSGLMTLIETKARWSTGKAGWKDDSRVKIKVAQEEYPEFEFVAAFPGKIRGSWEFETFGDASSGEGFASMVGASGKRAA